MFDLRRSSGGFGGLVDRAGQVSNQKIKAQWRHGAMLKKKDQIPLYSSIIRDSPSIIETWHDECW
jgi:hypothetical protein